MLNLECVGTHSALKEFPKFHGGDCVKMAISSGSKKRRFWRSKTILVIVLILAITIAIVGGILLPFRQTAPPIPRGPVSVLSATCEMLTPSITTWGPSFPDFVLFNCDTDPAFTVQVTGSATPTFDLTGTGYGTGATDFLIVPAPALNCGGGTTLHSGTSVAFTHGQNFDYCVFVGQVPADGLHSFDINWA